MNASCQYKEEVSFSIHGVPEAELREWAEREKGKVDTYPDFLCVTFVIGTVQVKLFT